MKKIVITFDTQGGSEIEAFGFSGGECLKATKSFEDALGKVTSRKMKSDHEMVTEKQTVSAR